MYRPARDSDGLMVLPIHKPFDTYKNLMDYIIAFKTGYKADLQLLHENYNTWYYRINAYNPFASYKTEYQQEVMEIYLRYLHCLYNLSFVYENDDNSNMPDINKCLKLITSAEHEFISSCTKARDDYVEYFGKKTITTVILLTAGHIGINYLASILPGPINCDLLNLPPIIKLHHKNQN